jgi:hypothetical protein
MIMIAGPFSSYHIDTDGIRTDVTSSEPWDTEQMDGVGDGLKGLFYKKVNQDPNVGTEFFAETEKSLILINSDGIEFKDPRQERAGDEGFNSIRIRYHGANDVNPKGKQEERLTFNDESNHHILTTETDTRGLRCVTYEDLYDYINLDVWLTPLGPKYEFVVKPAGKVDDIHIQVEGTNTIDLSNGEIIIQGPTGLFWDTGLKSYYQDDPSQIVESEFALFKENTYGFTLGNYDTNRTVVIDPLITGSFLGGSGIDGCSSIEVDEDGYMYIVGGTNSPEFPRSDGNGGSSRLDIDHDILISKVSPDGRRLISTTVIGGDGFDGAVDAILGDEGVLVIAGTTDSTDLPTTEDAFQRGPSGAVDSLLLIVDISDLKPVYLSYFGGTGDDFLRDLERDRIGNLILSGTTNSSDLPTSPSVIGTEKGGGFDGFIAVLSKNGSKLEGCTYLGGQSNDGIYSLAVDANDDIHLLGMTLSDDLPVSPSAFQQSRSDYTDLFIARLTLVLDDIGFLTYIGGSYYEYGGDVIIDKEGDVYFAAQTDSMDFPNISRDISEYKGSDIVLFKLDKEGSTLEYTLFLGGMDWESIWGLGVDRFGDLYLCGDTDSEDFPTTEDAVLSNLTGSSDAFLVRVAPGSMDVAYSTLLGGSGSDYAIDMAFGKEKDVYVVGETSSADFPVTAYAFQPLFAYGETDGFVSRILTHIDEVPPTTHAGEDQIVVQNDRVHFNGSSSTDDIGIKYWNWSFSYNGTTMRISGETSTFVFEVAGEYNVTLNVSDRGGNWAIDTVSITVLDITPPLARTNTDTTVNQDEQVTLDGSMSTDDVGVSGWEWTITWEGGTITLSGMTVDYTFQDVGDYLVTLNVTDASGNWDTSSFTVTVLDTTEPVARAGDDVVVDQGEEFVLDGRGSTDNVAITEWTWSYNIGGGTVEVSGNRVVARIPAVGVYHYVIRVADEEGNWAEDTVVVRVRDSTSPVAEAGHDKTVEEGTTVTLTSTESTDNVGVTAYRWTFEYRGETIMLEGSEVKYEFERPGTYQVTLSVEDGEGNTGTDVMTVHVTPVDEGGSAASYLLVLIVAVVLVMLVIYKMRAREE